MSFTRASNIGHFTRSGDPALSEGYVSGFFSRVIRNKHEGERITFKHNTIYVLPSLTGFGFIAVSALNFVLGINYQNNLLLGVAYLMIMLLVVSIIYGYLNMNGTHVKLVAIKSAHCSVPPTVIFELSTKASLQQLSIEHNLLKQQISVPSVQTCEHINMPFELPRGKHVLGRFKFVSHFPFGLVSVWSYLYCRKSIYAYPDPLVDSAQRQMFESHKKDDQFTHSSTHLSDEFKQLTPYQSGMNMHRISWRHYAKTQQLLIKDYEGETGAQTLGFDFDHLQGNVEERLAKLCYLVLQADQHNLSYALKLGPRLIAAAQGEQHKVKCLEALSDF
ncbi:DUF58 domain-containing protein [Pseudoalteromonas sp. MMG022]|uniref:DUF58 domain-containing protein n=1 Tax=Pseudoalteromonas sp. MMG022 TaxID=2909978 RepID=UPI001F1F4435|nr:DUF58 domain-containing protein [Pseudoalteromonas sp. MMG022]MCF6433988.1 DUF58 domain-containing protein [Pseudoalteromonas sp. MMG022]